MCTVTWSVHPDGYELVFSRDELFTRSLAQSADRHTVGNVSVLYSRDPDSAGTWLSVNRFGVCICVLNEYGFSEIASGTARISRGTLPVHLGHHSNLPELRAAVFATDLSQFAPFRLCAVAPGEPVLQLIWTGQELIEQLGDAPFVTSSSYRTRAVCAARRARFDAFRTQLRGTPQCHDLLSFHRSTHRDPAFGVAMKRHDGQTVSLSHVKVNTSLVQLEYYAGHPQQTEQSEPAVITLAREHRLLLPLPPPVTASERTFDIGRMASRTGFGKRPRERVMLHGLRWLLKERQLNQLLSRLGRLRPRQFPERALVELGVTVTVRAETEHVGDKPVYVANHPLGGVDGLALLAWILSRHGAVVVPVNAVLAGVPHLRSLVVGLERGRPNRALSAAMHSVFQANAPVLVFPAGATSRPAAGGLQDPPWSSAFLRLADRYHRPVVPAFVSGANSSVFYGVAKARRALGVRTNLEMFLLPREMLRSKSRTVNITVGIPVTPRTSTCDSTLVERVASLRANCYALANTRPASGS